MFEVLTHQGFKEFDGISNNGISESVICITFDNQTDIKCTLDHEFLMSDGITYLPAQFIDIGDILYNDIIVISINESLDEIVYDLLNVKDTHSYITNDVVSHNCLALDEFAFVHDAETFYMSTYPVITSGEDIKVIITSTPNGIGNMFYKIWQGAIQNSSEFRPLRIDWWEVPGRDEEWKRKTVSNTSELQFSQEFSCEFIGSANTLISPNTLLGLQALAYIELHNDVKYFAKPVEGRTYIMTVDVSKGRGQDYSTFNVIDVSTAPFKQVAVYRNNIISPLLFPDIIVRVAKLFNNALVIIENNDAGHIVCNAVYHEYEYENTFVESAVKALGVGVTMTKRVKRIGCSNLKDIVESGKLEIVDVDTIAELSSFESKGGSYEAGGNSFDDLVMNLVLFSWFVSTSIFQDSSSVNLKNLLYADRIKEMEDDVIPFGIIIGHPDDQADMSAYDELIRAQKEWSL